MSRIIRIGSVTLAVALAVLSVVLAGNGLGEGNAFPFIEGRAIANKTVTLTGEVLKSVALEDYVIKEGKTDKRFRIPLSNGAYIDGAILLNDCDYQYTGARLGDAFGLHNTDSEPNAYNFNILLSFEHIVEMGIDVDVYSYNTLASEYSMAMVKFAHVGDSFYNALESTDYSVLTGLPGSSAFYANGAKDYNYRTFPLEASHTQSEVVWQPESGNLNLAAFQFTYYNNNLIDNGNEITCTIRSLRFEYSCN